jgi:CRISPR-associated protein Cas2
METFLVAYDICDPRRLRKVARVAQDFGLRKQYSVFFCRLSARDLVRLKARLMEIVDSKRDRVLFVPVCGRCIEGIETLGQSMARPDSQDVVIVT